MDVLGSINVGVEHPVTISANKQTARHARPGIDMVTHVARLAGMGWIHLDDITPGRRALGVQLTRELAHPVLPHGAVDVSFVVVAVGGDVLGGLSLRASRVSAEGLIEGVFGAEESRGRQLRYRGCQDGQLPAVSQGEGHRLERAGAQPVRVGQQTESANPLLRRTAGTRRVRLTSLSACSRACSVAESRDAG